MYDYFVDYIIQKSYLTFELCNPKTSWRWQKKIKMYFHMEATKEDMEVQEERVNYVSKEIYISIKFA